MLWCWFRPLQRLQSSPQAALASRGTTYARALEATNAVPDSGKATQRIW